MCWTFISFKFQSTLPARGATSRLANLSDMLTISIHAPRTGSDVLRFFIRISVNRISIHAPRTGSDFSQYLLHPSLKYFNPRSPHGERLHQGAERRCSMVISIHAPRTGSDAPPQYGGTRIPGISIHAPRTGSDDFCGKVVN